MTTVAILASLTLAGCATNAPSGPNGADPGTSQQGTSEQRAALDKYVELERAQLPAVQKANPGVYEEMTVEAEYPGTIVFRYVYATQVDAAEAVKYLDEMESKFQELCDDTVFPAMKQTGVTGDLGATYIYINADGTTMWEKTFASS